MDCFGLGYFVVFPRALFWVLKMSKKFSVKSFSVRGSSDYLDVRIFSSGKVVFKGGCPVGDREKVRSLISVLKAKGVLIPKDDNNWWD